MTSDRLRWSLVLAVLFAVLLPGTVSAGDVSVDSLLERLAETYKDIPSVEADFTQTSTGMAYVEPLVQTGTVALERPARMRWQFAVPTQQEYLSDGSSLWVVNVGDKTCTIYRQLDATLARYFDFLTGMADVRAHFEVSLGAPVEGRDVLVLVPLDKNGTIGSISIQIARDTGLVMGMVNASAFGDLTDVQLSNVRTGRDIPDEEFSWTPRDGYREIEG